MEDKEEIDVINNILDEEVENNKIENEDADADKDKDKNRDKDRDEVEDRDKAESEEKDEDEDEGNHLKVKNKKSNPSADGQRRGTKIQEFNFQHRDVSREKNTKNTLKVKYIDQFVEESSKNIMKQATMSRKMILKTISSIYSAALLKKNGGELECLSGFAYDEFCARYGQKSVVNKKLNDLMSSVLKYPDSRKTVNFAKLIGISEKIGLENYVKPKETFNFLINLMDLIQKSNLGIIVNLDENLDYQFIPAIRAVECSKEILSPYLESGKIQNIITTIEKNSHPDPKKINKFGIIDQEFLQELLLAEYDIYNQNAINDLG